MTEQLMAKVLELANQVVETNCTAYLDIKIGDSFSFIFNHQEKVSVEDKNNNCLDTDGNISSNTKDNETNICSGQDVVVCLPPNVNEHTEKINVQVPDLATSHALLARDSSVEVLAVMASIPLERKKLEAEGKTYINYVINKIYQAVKQDVHKCRTEGFGEKCDPRLESFLHYLVANDVSVDLYRRALLEQVALKELDNVGKIGIEVGRMARESIKFNSTSIIVEAGIDVWHKTYYQFRIAVNYLALGVEKYLENLNEIALELLTNSYLVNEKIAEDPPYPNNPCKVMFQRGWVKHFHLLVEAFNTRLVDQFKTGEEPRLVASKVNSVLAPAIYILQSRANRSPGGKDSALLKDTRGKWSSINSQPLLDRKNEYWGIIFNTVMVDDVSVMIEPEPNLSYQTLLDDFELGTRYKAVMKGI